MLRTLPAMSALQEPFSDDVTGRLSASLIGRHIGVLPRKGRALILLLALAMPLSAPATQVALAAQIDCAAASVQRAALPMAADTLHLVVPESIPAGTLLELREAGQDLTLHSDAPNRTVQTPPRYGVTLYRVQHPMAIRIGRLRPGGGLGALEMRLHCDPVAGEQQWRWFGHANELAARFTGGVGSLRDAFPDALLAAVKEQAFDPRSRALAAHLAAQALLLAGRAADASKAFEHAALAWQRIDDTQRASAAWVGVVEDLNRSGQYPRVLSLSRAAMAAPDGRHYFGVRLENARCLALHYLHQLDAATACYAWTSARLDALDETLELASTGIDYAAVEVASGNAAAARQLLLDSLALAQGAQSMAVQGRAQLELAGLARDQGDIAEALRRLQQAQERFAAAAEPRWQASALLRLAALLNELHAVGDARAAVQRVLTLLDTRHAPARVAAAQLLLARIELDDGDADAGLAHIGPSLAAFQELGMPEEAARAQLLKARLLLQAGRVDDASNALAAASVAKSRNGADGNAYRLIGAELAMQAGKFEQSTNLLRGLNANLTLSEQLERTRLLAESDWRAGRRGKAHAALRTHARALVALSQRTGNPVLAHTLRAAIATLRQTAIDLLAQELDAGNAGSEQWLPLLTPWLLDPAGATVRGPVNSPSGAELDAALSALLLADSAAGETGKAGTNTIHFVLLDRLARAADGADTAIAESDRSPAALGAIARPGQPLLALLQGRQRLLRLWIEADTEPLLDSLDADALRQQLQPLRRLLARPDGNLALIDAHARALSQQVFSGLGELAQPQRLQVIGDRLVSAIPWPALYWRQASPPLAEASEVVLLSLVAEPAPRRAAPERIAVLLAAQDGDVAANGLPTLSAAAFEPALIQRDSPNRQIQALAVASREQTLSLLAEPGAWLHVSAHGRTQSDRLLASGLWLNPQDGSNDPQFLSWADLFERGVAADLVVLNACQLAQSDGAAANAALDFAAAVSRAGARDTIAVQWPVSDTASAVWVPAFYRALAAGGEHPDPAQALAEARRALRASRAFRHPFHWAGWVHWQRVNVGE
jgi:CHAT domain-containing protein